MHYEVPNLQASVKDCVDIPYSVYFLHKIIQFFSGSFLEAFLGFFRKCCSDTGWFRWSSRLFVRKDGINNVIVIEIVIEVKVIAIVIEGKVIEM